MATEVILPRVDMDMATGRISKWHAKDGDKIAQGQPLFEIETDKAAMEIEAPASGILRNITVSEGSEAPVGSAVAWIYAEGEAVSSPAAKALAPVLPRKQNRRRRLLFNRQPPRLRLVAFLAQLHWRAGWRVRKVFRCSKSAAVARMAASWRKMCAMRLLLPPFPPRALPRMCRSSTHPAATPQFHSMACAAPLPSASPSRSRPFRISICLPPARSTGLLAARQSLNGTAPKNADGKPL